MPAAVARCLGLLAGDNRPSVLSLSPSQFGTKIAPRPGTVSGVVVCPVKLMTGLPINADTLADPTLLLLLFASLL